MIERVAGLPTLNELQQHVHLVLCEQDHIDPEQSPLLQAIIKRAEKPCGLFFEVQGPRQLKTHAVWAGDEGRILFYDSKGIRFAQTRLTESPDPLKLAKAAS